MMVPSMLNSITAWARPMAAILPASSMPRIFCAVMSVANLTTRNGLPFLSRIGLYDAWIQTSLPPLAIRLYSAAWYLPRPELPIGGGLALRRFHKHAVVLALDFA